jgi:hypothetical protein
VCTLSSYISRLDQAYSISNLLNWLDFTVMYCALSAPSCPYAISSLLNQLDFTIIFFALSAPSCLFKYNVDSCSLYEHYNESILIFFLCSYQKILLLMCTNGQKLLHALLIISWTPYLYSYNEDRHYTEIYGCSSYQKFLIY